jgi:hypothetical protein
MISFTIFNCLKTRERVGINNVFLLSEYFIKSKANWRALASAEKIELLFGKHAEKKIISLYRCRSDFNFVF